MPPRAELLPSIDDVRKAALRLKGEASRTPLLEARMEARIPGPVRFGRVFLKPEILQVTGSFKYRGAFNKIASEITRSPGLEGVVAFSSGNHAQGVAAAARRLQRQAVIVMPEDAPSTKIANTRALGGEVVLYDRYSQDREAIARAIATERGYALVPPYDDPAIIAGQGTIGLEIAEDMAAMGIAPEIVLAPCSGGGLVSGVALGITAQFPETLIYSCEPATLDDHARSLALGRRVENPPEARSICDALMSRTPGELTFAINSRLLKGGLSASDEEVLAAMAFAIRHLKLVVEPGGAVALAALLSGRVETRGKNCVVILSGGNADDAMIQRALAENPAAL